MDTSRHYLESANIQGLRAGCYYHMRGGTRFGMFQSRDVSPSSIDIPAGALLLCHPASSTSTGGATPAPRARESSSSLTSTSAFTTTFKHEVLKPIRSTDAYTCPAETEWILDARTCEDIAETQGVDTGRHFLKGTKVAGLKMGCYYHMRGDIRFAMFQARYVSADSAGVPTGPLVLCLQAGTASSIDGTTTAPETSASFGGTKTTTTGTMTSTMQLFDVVRAPGADECPAGSERILETVTCRAVAQSHGVDTTSHYLENTKIQGLMRGCYYHSRGERRFAMFQSDDVVPGPSGTPVGPLLLCLRIQGESDAHSDIDDL